MNSLIFRKTIAYQQWKSFEETFSSTTQSKILDLRSQLQTLRKEGLFVSEYIAKAQPISHHLVAVSEPISDHDLVMYALVGLIDNSTYNPFVTTIKMAQPKPNFTSFHSQLETFERMILNHYAIDKDKAFHANFTYVSWNSFG